jgi:hypothetical protein
MVTAIGWSFIVTIMLSGLVLEDVITEKADFVAI